MFILVSVEPTMVPLGNEGGVVRFYFQYGHVYVIGLIALSVKMQVCFYIHRVALLWTREQVRRQNRMSDVILKRGQSWPKS